MQLKIFELMTMMTTVMMMANHLVILISTEKGILFLRMKKKVMTLVRRIHLVKNQVTKKIVGIDSQDAVATDNETTESGKAATNDVSDKSDQQSATTTNSDTASTNKRVAAENFEVKKGKKAKKNFRNKY